MYKILLLSKTNTTIISDCRWILSSWHKFSVKFYWISELVHEQPFFASHRTYECCVTHQRHFPRYDDAKSQAMIWTQVRCEMWTFLMVIPEEFYMEGQTCPICTQGHLHTFDEFIEYHQSLINAHLIHLVIFSSLFKLLFYTAMVAVQWKTVLPVLKV